MDFSGFSAPAWTDESPVLELIHDAGSAAVSETKSALQQ
jgi:hypothetical protein